MVKNVCQNTHVHDSVPCCCDVLQKHAKTHFHFFQRKSISSPFRMLLWDQIFGLILNQVKKTPTESEAGAVSRPDGVGVSESYITQAPPELDPRVHYSTNASDGDVYGWSHSCRREYITDNFPLGLTGQL